MNKIKKILPRGSWVLVKPAEKESRETEQGLILPESEEREQKAVGIVEAVGEDVKGLKKGDEVIYGMFAGENIKRRESIKKVTDFAAYCEEVEYKILLDEDIIALLE